MTDCVIVEFVYFLYETKKRTFAFPHFAVFVLFCILLFDRIIFCNKIQKRTKTDKNGQN